VRWGVPTPERIRINNYALGCLKKQIIRKMVPISKV
jgi:hypothetical protein